MKNGGTLEKGDAVVYTHPTWKGRIGLVTNTDRRRDHQYLDLEDWVEVLFDSDEGLTYQWFRSDYWKILSQRE